MEMQDRENAIEQIYEVVKQYVNAVHTQDEESFRRIWSKKEKCVLISIGNAFYGLDSIYENFLIGAIQANYSEITLVPDDIKINMYGDGFAIVVFRYHTECTRREDGSFYGIEGLETQVIKKENDEWKLCHIHYSKSNTLQ